MYVYYMYMYVKHKLKTTFNDLIFLMHQSVHIHMFVYIVLVSPKLLNCGVFIKCVNFEFAHILYFTRIQTNTIYCVYLYKVHRIYTTCTVRRLL